MQRQLAALTLGLALMPALTGCSRSEPEPSATTGASVPSAAESSSGDATPSGPLLAPFDPPTLEELEKTVKWRDMPVVDAMERLREEQAKEKQLATIDEALRLKNTSSENNAKIVSAIGRLPEDDSKVDYEATITRHIGADLRNMNPIFFDSAVEGEVFDLCSFGLFAFDRHLDMFAAKDTVVSWQTSEDGLYDKVVMRDDLTWSDGQPITAHDIVFSFKTIMDENVPVMAVRSGTDQLKWVEAYDDHTVVFFHKEALATNPWNMLFPTIPKHFFEPLLKKDPTLNANETHQAVDQNLISGGPYVITKRERGQEIVLARRDTYYMHNGKQVRDKPFFKQVRFQILKDPNTWLLAQKKGDIDECMLQPEQWQSQTGDDEFYGRNTKLRGDEWTYFYFGWNTKDPKFSDVRVRKAMSYAYNYNELLNTLLYGLYRQSVGIYHPDAWMSPKPAPEPYKMSLDKAEDLLDEAGWADSDGDGVRDKDGVRFDFTLLCTDANPLALKVADLLKQNLERIGVLCNVKPTEFTVMQELLLKKKFEAYMGGWGTGAEPDTGRNLFLTGEERNHVQYSNKEVDRLFEEGRREFDHDKRAEIYGKIATLIYEDQPYTFLYVRSSLYALNKRLRGFNFSPRDPFGYSPGFGSIWAPAAN